VGRKASLAPLLALSALSALSALGGCRGGARSWRPLPQIPEAAIAAATLPTALPPEVTEGQIPGTPAIRVTWEALKVEVHRLNNPSVEVRQRARPLPGVFQTKPELKITLLNASHPEAVKMRLRAAENRSQRFEAEFAILPDEDMLGLLRGLEEAKFFLYAKPTSALAYLFPSENARGRVTVENGDQSVTVLSLRGLGLDEATRPIQGIYSQAKTAISLLKNRTPNMSVVHFGATPPRSAPR
jgi:hypothetical protein